MLVYINSDTCNWHLNLINESIDRTFDLDYFKTYHGYKLALLHVPFPYQPQFESLIDSLSNHCTKIIILCSELHPSTVDFIKRYQNNQLEFFINGVIDQVPTNNWMDWFITSTDFYQTSQVLDQLTYTAKPKQFDVLLGQRRVHRDLLYLGINKQFSNNVIMSYVTDSSTSLKTQSHSNWLWQQPELCFPESDFNHTVTMVTYHNYQMRLSQVIPIQIYNQTAYSIVAETNCDNYYMFPTEKIVKPILAKRLFIVCSGQHYLKNLRSFGFKTFDGIIDESYDNESNLEHRCQLILEQMRYLIDQDQLSVFKQIQPIVEHNYQVMMETNWLSSCSNKLSLLIQT